MTTILIALAVIAVAVGGAVWLARSGGARDERQKQRKRAMDAMERIAKARAEATDEVDKDLADSDFRRRIVERLRRFTRGD